MKRRKGISTLSSHVTSTISVALVLLLIGIVAALVMSATFVTDSIKENIGFDIELKQDASESDINGMKQMFTGAEFVSSFAFYSADDAMRQWSEDTGEDLEELVGANPFSPEFEVKVKPAYASTDSIAAITADIRKKPIVADITVHTAMVDSINRNLRTLSLVLIAVAAAMTFISFVLINNTVRLAIYSRRFLIHTMKLVGATGGFIRRPFIRANAVEGLVAALLAMTLLGTLLYYAFTLDPIVAEIFTPGHIAAIAGGMLAAGLIICVVASWIATNRYLRKNYDDLFK